MFARVAHEIGSPDQEFWSQFSTRAPAETIIADPDFYCSEGSMIGVAFAP
jgi:hypothetical protein